MTPSSPAGAAGVGGGAVHPSWTGHALVIVAAMLGGTSGLVGARLFALGATAAEVGMVRVLVATAGLSTAVVVTGGIGRLRAAARLPAVWAGLGVAVFQVAYFRAVAAAGVGTSTVVTTGMQPVVTAALAAILLKEPLSGRWAAATAVSFSGLVVLLLSTDARWTRAAAGLAFAVLAGLGFAVFTIASRWLLVRGAEPIAISTVALLVATAVLSPTIAGADLRWLPDPGSIALVLYIGLGTIALSYALYAQGLSRVRAATASTLVIAEPVTAAVLGIVVLHEGVGGSAWLGAALVLTGFVLLSRRQSSTKGPDLGNP